MVWPKSARSAPWKLNRKAASVKTRWHDDLLSIQRGLLLPRVDRPATEGPEMTSRLSFQGRVEGRVIRRSGCFGWGQT